MATSSLPASYPLTAYHGDTWHQTFRFKHTASSPVDLTGATVAAWAQSHLGPVTELTATVLDPLAGEVQIGIGPEGLPKGSYTYDVEITQAGVITTWVVGTLTVSADITNLVAL